MKQKELEQIIEKYPEISSISIHCSKFPEWLNILPEDDSTCGITYVNGINVFFHLEEKKMTKNLYKGNFNWYGQLFVLYTQTNNESNAFNNFCKQLTKKVGYSINYVRNYFLQFNRDGYLITLNKRR